MAASLPTKAAVRLSDDAVLVYVLAESGVRGRLNSGSIERGSGGTIEVFDVFGKRFDYISGNRLRSWCVMDAQGKTLDGWREILPQDLPKFPGGA